MVCGTTTCRMARNPSRVAVKRREVGGLQGEAFSALDLSEIGCVESHPTRISGRSSVDPAPRRCHCRHFQGQNRHFQGRRRRNFHTRQIRKSLGGFSKISRHTNRNKITVSFLHRRGGSGRRLCRLFCCRLRATVGRDHSTLGQQKYVPKSAFWRLFDDNSRGLSGHFTGRQAPNHGVVGP